MELNAIQLKNLLYKQEARQQKLILALENKETAYFVEHSKPDSFVIAMYTPQQGWLLSQMGISKIEEMQWKRLFRRIQAQYKGIHLPIHMPMRLKKDFETYAKQKFTTLFEQGFWCLQHEQLKMPKNKNNGYLKKATTSDLAWCAQALSGFLKEALPHKKNTAQAVEKKCVSKIARGDLYLWHVAEKPVAMASCVRQTNHVAAVSLVYTPALERGKGYGKAVTAALSQELLKNVKNCCLFTDLANPISGKIYHEIGYRQTEHFCLLSPQNRL